MHPMQGGIVLLSLVLRCGMTHLAGKQPSKTEADMPAILTEIQTRLRQRAAYIRTRNALRDMPLNVAIDLDIYPYDADKLAAKAVYGR